MLVRSIRISVQGVDHDLNVLALLDVHEVKTLEKLCNRSAYTTAAYLLGAVFSNLQDRKSGRHKTD